ncbi:hypothetical protein EDD18DRAFT_1157404 [Armillaria luteobubalina]|uniref:Secreted protein n=1 Tax=Armillaria luteobubalina TaxID=153913 RepID=A0AA39QA56_9AGAR|nr:hypothetical protein EDD18DRAFT_1157404 [Armillaria luteobubalina]
MEPCLLLILSLLQLLSRVFRTKLPVVTRGVDIFSHGGYEATGRSIIAVKDVLPSFSRIYSLHQPFESIQRVRV